MDTPVISSTLFLTILLGIGLFFFIRASVKDRTERVKLASARSQEALLEALQQYFIGRAYQPAPPTISEGNPHGPYQLTFDGFVRPSLFLAFFLSGLAAMGLLCLSLVLAMLFPEYSYLFLGLMLLAPVAGVFYWQKAGRYEQVILQLEANPTPNTQTQSLVTVTAHRDELLSLQNTLSLSFWDE